MPSSKMVNTKTSGAQEENLIQSLIQVSHYIHYILNFFEFDVLPLTICREKYFLTIECST